MNFKKDSALRFVAPFVLALGTAHAGFAQTLYGGLTGVVTDPTGAAVPGAKVTATNPATGLTRSDAADNSGTYQFTDLPPGNYDVTITAPGFGTATSKAVAIGEPVTTIRYGADDRQCDADRGGQYRSARPAD